MYFYSYFCFFCFHFLLHFFYFFFFVPIPLPIYTIMIPCIVDPCSQRSVWDDDSQCGYFFLVFFTPTFPRRECNFDWRGVAADNRCMPMSHFLLFSSVVRWCALVLLLICPGGHGLKFNCHFWALFRV